MSAGSHLVVMGLCLVFGAFFAGMETGMLAFNRIRLRHLVRRRVGAAVVVDRLLHRPEVLLGTTLIGTNLSYVMLSVFSTRLATDLWGRAGPAIASASVTLVVLVGCEYLPKAWFQSFPARRVLPLVRVLDVFARLFLPLSWMLHGVVRWLVPARDESAGEHAALVTREELMHLAREGMDTGMLTGEESRMIRSVFALGGKTCGDVMIPMDRVICLSSEAGIERIRALALEHGYSRYPVRRAGPGGVIGILHLRDVLARLDLEGETVGTLMRPPHFVASGMSVDHVLPRMRATGSPMMLVTGERHEVIGIVTIEEVLAEIVGAA